MRGNTEGLREEIAKGRGNLGEDDKRKGFEIRGLN